MLESLLSASSFVNPPPPQLKSWKTSSLLQGSLRHFFERFALKCITSDYLWHVGTKESSKELYSDREKLGRMYSAIFEISTSNSTLLSNCQHNLDLYLSSLWEFKQRKMLGQALRIARTTLFRRNMTTGRMPEQIGEGGKTIVSYATYH
jgi:hypothetical protein